MDVPDAPRNPPRNPFGRLLLLVPLAVLAVAYAGVCQQTGSVWPWNLVAHEDGKRTLLATVFYFEHATRELPLDLCLALAVAGAAAAFWSPRGTPGARRNVRVAGALAVLSILVVLGGSVATVGAASTLDNVLQKPTRGGAELVWGAHWRYHFLSRLALLLLAWSVAGFVAGGRRIGGRRTFQVSLVLFAVLTLVFRPTLEPFRDALFLGHQARELMTHTLATLPLALAAVACVASYGGGTGEPAWRGVAFAFLGSVLLGAWLLVGALLTGAQDQGQAGSLGALLWAHFFEHALGYCVVPSVACWAFGRLASDA